jgi:lia operon protein LiaG
LEISNSSGDIEIEDAAARGTLSVMASSGRIDFGKTEAARIEIVSKSGNTRIGDLKGEIDVQSSSGNVTLGLRTLTGNVAVTCSSGNIRLTIPAGSRYSVDIEVKSGNVTLDDQVIGVVGQSRGEIRGDANGGGTLIMLRASSGNVSIVH